MKILFWSQFIQEKGKPAFTPYFFREFFVLVLLPCLPSQRCKKKTKHSSLSLPQKHMFLSNNIEVVHYLFRAHKIVITSSVPKGSVNNAELKVSCSHVVLLVVCCCQFKNLDLRFKATLQAVTARSCSVTKTPEIFSSTCCGCIHLPARARGAMGHPKGDGVRQGAETADMMLQEAKEFREKHIPPAA